MSLPQMNPDRRRLPRTNLECLAYINFEPDNGGIVLNISEEGLRFHAVAPIEVNTKASFWFSADKGRLASDGLVVWADVTRRTGGMRFDHLSPEARRQIRIWIGQSSKPLARPRRVAAPIPQSRLQAPVVNRAYLAASEALQSFWRRVRTPRWSEFSRGLVTGLLFALLVTTLLSLRTRQRIGDALIWLGERFEPTLPPRVAASPPPSSTAPLPKLAVQPMEVPPATGMAVSTPPLSEEKLSDEKPTLPALRSVAPRIHAKLTRATDLAPTVPSPSIPSLPLASSARASVLLPPEDARLASPAKVLAAKAVDRSSENESAEDIVEINSGLPLGRYFEVGKFKDESACNQMRRDLEKSGFRSVVRPKKLLWMKSYQVLVGPYHNEQDAQGARRNLQADGFKPRSPGAHSRQLTVVVPWAKPIDGTAEQDDFIVTWEAYSADANVKLVEGSQIGRTVPGKWVTLPTRSDYTAIVYTTSKTGERTLLSIQFYGMNQAVMLPNSTDRSIVF